MGKLSLGPSENKPRHSVLHLRVTKAKEDESSSLNDTGQDIKNAGMARIQEST